MTSTMRRTLEELRAHPRMTAWTLAHYLWPAKRLHTAHMPITEGRLRAAARAGYAHVAFEPYQYQPHLRRPVYEISARGRAALSGA